MRAEKASLTRLGLMLNLLLADVEDEQLVPRGRWVNTQARSGNSAIVWIGGASIAAPKVGRAGVHMRRATSVHVHLEVSKVMVYDACESDAGLLAMRVVGVDMRWI